MAPGTAGCRNVKWVRTIQVQAQPSELDSGSKLDRHFAPDVPFKCPDSGILAGEEKLRLDQGPVIQTLPVQSVLTEPQNGDVLSLSGCSNGDAVTVRGVAWAGGGRGCTRSVEPHASPDDLL